MWRTRLTTKAMNREIKFRGKRIDNGEWVEGWYYPRSSFLIPNQEPEVYEVIQVSADQQSWFKVDPSTIGQFTGLQDKHGKDSYYQDFVFANGVKALIVWHNMQWHLNFNWEQETDKGLDPLYLYESFEIEIIGTIHDNNQSK